MVNEMDNTTNIFICGTQVDLFEERSAVIDAIARLRLRHESMEYFGARTEQPIDVCLEHVRNSDIVIVIVGRIYGSLVPGKKISFTETEYCEAFSLRKTCLVYFRHDEVKISAKQYEMDPEKFKLLEKFRDTLKERHTIVFFHDSRELAVQLSVDLSRILERRYFKGNYTGKYIDALTKGRLFWNKFRQDDLEMVPNLAGADLKGMNLSYYDFSHVDMSGANVQGADLSNSNLFQANLQKADFGGVKLGGTFFIDVDLRETAGLGFCEHYAESILDYSTLKRSLHLPESFLRGCGLPNRVIDYLPSLLGELIQFYSCFISYSAGDEAFAKRLHADLQNNGVRCWFAPHDLPIGAKTWEVINEAIQTLDKVLLILSKNAIASDWVEYEVTKAFAEERPRNQLVLIPVRIDDAVMVSGEPWAVKLRDQRNIGDFRQWKDHDAYQQALERLLHDLKTVPE